MINGQGQGQGQGQEGRIVGITKAASSSSSKPTIYVKSASAYNKHKKLGELGAIIRGTSYPSLEPVFQTQTKGASVIRKPGPIEREVKLKNLAKLVRG